MTYAFIGLGSNAGNRRRHLRTAARRLRQLRGARLVQVSPVYGSAPVGCPGRQQAYYNAAAAVQTTLAPQRLFVQLRQLERAVQKKPRRQNAPRRLDADYLAHGCCRRRHAHLTLPHPRLYGRAFALQPLADVLPAAPSLAADARARVHTALAHCRTQPLCRLYRLS